jgi:hypothetical protein
MNKVTKAQIEEWKKKHGTIFEIESDGKFGYIFDPVSDLRIMKSFISAQSEESMKAIDVILNNCWLGGDEDLKKDDCKMSLLEQVNEIIEIPEFEIINHKDHYLVKVDDLECKLKPAQRGDLKYAEDRNKMGKPFDTNIHLLERLTMTDLGPFKKDNRKYLALLLAVKDAKQKKDAFIKKL